MSHPANPDPTLDRLAADWIALWESEVAAVAQDVELAEAWAASMALGAAFWRAQLAQAALWARARESAPPNPAPPNPAPPARPAPAAAASDAGGGAGHGGDDAALRSRIAELERRLAALEHRPAGSEADRGKPRAPRRR